MPPFPAANNRLALALGTAANQRAYDAEATIYGLIEDIADAAIAVDANGVIIGAGPARRRSSC